MMMKAPVGPPIWTLLPPNAEITNPATIAVIIPFSGVTPDAIPKAMAKGRATIPTIIPAITSAMNVLRLYLRRQWSKRGLKSNVCTIKKV